MPRLILALLLSILLSACRPAQEAIRLPPPAPAGVELPVYFTSLPRYTQGISPYEVAVRRVFPPGADLPGAVLDEFFKGPSNSIPPCLEP